MMILSVRPDYFRVSTGIACNGSGVNEVALLQNFKNSRNSKGQFHLTICYMKCFFGEGKRKRKICFKNTFRD